MTLCTHSPSSVQWCHTEGGPWLGWWPHTNTHTRAHCGESRQQSFSALCRVPLPKASHRVCEKECVRGNICVWHVQESWCCGLALGGQPTLPSCSLTPSETYSYLLVAAIDAQSQSCFPLTAGRWSVCDSTWTLPKNLLSLVCEREQPNVHVW